MGRNRRHRIPVAQRRIIETRNPAPDGLDPALAWFLVYTTPRGEERAVRGLQEAGCVTFWPSLHRVTLHGKRRSERSVGVFPRYLFASGPLFPAPLADGAEPIPRQDIRVGGRPISSARDIDGVANVIRGTSGRVCVPSPVIAAIAAMQNAAAVEKPKSLFPFKERDTVRIVDGPFADFHAVVQKALSPLVAEVLITMFGRSTRAEMDIAQLAAA